MPDQSTTSRIIPVESRLEATEAALARAIVERDNLRDRNESQTQIIAQLQVQLDNTRFDLRQARAAIRTQTLSFKDLREANLVRCKESFHYSPDEWSPERWMLAMGGELGETLEAVLKMVMSGTVAMNSLKKVIRGDGDMAQVRKEVADVIIYGDFVLLSIGAEMGDAVREKFNETSEKVGSEVFL
jgi:NTP pyrophosphatase (non-canonical NTP hydrolase)